MDKVTLKQLADVLNYSISTVFKELNDKEEISFDIKIKIVDTPKKLGDQRLKNVLSFKAAIAVIITDVKNDFFAQVLIGWKDAATENN